MLPPPEYVPYSQRSQEYSQCYLEQPPFQVIQVPTGIPITGREPVPEYTKLCEEDPKEPEPAQEPVEKEQFFIRTKRMHFIQIPIPQEVFGEDKRTLKIVCQRLTQAVMNLERTVSEHERIIRIADEKFKEIDGRVSGLNARVDEVSEALSGQEVIEKELDFRIKKLEKKELLRKERKLRGEEIDALKTKVSELEKELS